MTSELSVKPINLDGVRAAKNAARAVRPPASETPEPPATETLPDNCPVRPLGVDGRVCYYLNADRQMVALSDRDHSRLGLLKMFGNRGDVLYSYWPRHSKTGEVTGWRPELAAELLMAACSTAGVWDAKERQRGRGAWLGDAGELVLHTGTHVMAFPPTPHPYRDHVSDRAGLVGRYVYSSATLMGVPCVEEAPGGSGGVADALLATLSTWNFRRGEMDAILTLGWIGAAMIGGALKWRPMVWLTGGAGTGKSLLQDLLRAVFAGTLIQTANTTSAGLYQTLRHQTLPIAVDELEAQEDNRKALAVVELARVAASGGLILRGGQDHAATEFVVRSAFLFSSILIPPLTRQDRTRISVLELDELTPGSASPKIDPVAYAAIGARLRRRLVDGWHRWGTTLGSYREALQARGHSARAADQLGTLLAAADLLLFDVSAEGSAFEWVDKLNASELTEAEDNTRDEHRCLAMLLSSPVDVMRSGARRTIGEWLRIAAEFDGTGDEADEAQRVLNSNGLKLLPSQPASEKGPAAPMRLAVAHYHMALSRIYQGSHWQGTSSSSGVWTQALKRLHPDASKRWPAVYFAGTVSRAVMIPLYVALPLDSVPPRHHDRLLKYLS